MPAYPAPSTASELREQLSTHLVRLDKVSGCAFLDAAAGLWRDRSIMMIGENAAMGINPARNIAIAPGGGWWQGGFTPDIDRDGDTEGCSGEDLAQISSTSGTTGTPKAIAISRRAISDTVARLVKHMVLTPDIREYIGVPVTFSFGLARARAVASVGGAAYLPENGFRPDEIAAMLRDGSINALSVVPTMLRTILANPEILGKTGPRLRWLEIGSQFMTADEKMAVRNLFPEAVILQHYGLTEASRSTFLRIDDTPVGRLGSIGKAVAPGDICINQTGCIAVKGPHLASGQIVDGQLQPLTDPQGWLATSDLGHEQDGWFYFDGRNDEVANIGGIKISAELFERQLTQEKPGKAIGVCILPDSLRGDKLAIATPPGSMENMLPAIGTIASHHGLNAADYIAVEIETLPRTATGKLQRKALAQKIIQQVEENNHRKTQQSPSSSNAPRLTAREAEIAALWREALQVEHIGPDDRFNDLGGDSLSAVSVMLKAEKAGLSPDILQRMLAGQSIAQIASAVDGKGGAIRAGINAIRADALNAVRGLFALMIVVSHWGPFFIDRMGVVGEVIWSVISPALRIGTPGFAMVYGFGLGLFFFGQLEKGRQQLRHRIHRNTKLVVTGVLLIAAMQALSFIATGTGFGPHWPEQLFYEVLLFYALMVPTSLFWLRRVAAFSNRIWASLLLAAGAYGVYLLTRAIVPENPFTGWASLGWHMMVAPYAYPRLLGATALGLTAALWLQNYKALQPLISRTAIIGGVLFISGFLFVAIMPGGWPLLAGELVAIPAFAGAALLLYSAAAILAQRQHKAWIFKLMIICGLMAFPIFIGHGMVIPLKIALEAWGMPPILALTLPVGAFAATMCWLGTRFYTMMFSQKKS